MENKKRNGRRVYLAYGSNLNVPQMKWRCPGAKILGTAELEGWQLLYRGSKTGSYLTVEKAEGGMVPVAVWEVTPEDEAALDRYEGIPRFYYKKEMKIRYKGITTRRMRTADAFIYIMHEDRPVGIPSEMYVDVCREGYDVFRFDKRILEKAWERSVRLVGKRESRQEGHKDDDSFWKNFVLVGGGHHGREN